MIFGCTWVAIHPNVPHPGDTTISRFLKRTRLVLFTLIAPEMTVMWAMRQFWASYKFKQKHNENGAFLFPSLPGLSADASYYSRS